MAVSSIGNLTFINQNAQVGAMTQASVQGRTDFTQFANLHNQKLNDVQEVKKLEENEALNPDRDSQQQGQEREQHQHKQKEEEQKLSSHLLDIRA